MGMAEGFSELPPDSGGKCSLLGSRRLGLERVFAALMCQYQSLPARNLVGITTDSRAIYSGPNKKKAGRLTREEPTRLPLFIRSINIEVTTKSVISRSLRACLAIA